MLRLQTLGQLDLQTDSDFAHPLVAHPKRLGLLVYLCTAPHAGFRRRDHLVSLFWPELDNAHARAALRQMLYVLRQRLGEHVLRQRGDDELGVNPEAIWCDATEFENACRDGQSHAAVALYRGDFLDGVHIAGASQQLDEWTDRERRRLRELARSATWAIAESSVVKHPAAAAPWIRRAVSLAPDDEPAFRRALALMEQVGDRSGALQMFHEFRARMAHEYEAEPATLTKVIAESLRHSDDPPVRAVGHTPDQPPEEVAEERVPTLMPASGTGPADRRLMLIVGSVIVVAAGLLLSRCVGT